MRHIAKLLLVVLFLFVFNLKPWAQTPYRQYSNNGVELNFSNIDDVYFRAYLLYNLSQDDRFILTAEEDNGIFYIGSSDESLDEGFFDTFEDIYNLSYTDFQILSKLEITDLYPVWKSQVDPRFFTSMMMDITLRNTREGENEHCINADPFCTSDFYEFDAASTDQTAQEQNMDDGCIGSSYNPSWYYLRIADSGPLTIHMEGHDPDNPNTLRDIDFCLWGPYTEEQVNSGYACTHLTSDKIIDCNYSASYLENAYMGYPEGEHVHNTGHGTVNYHVPQTGEYYLLMITNFSRQPCVITFNKPDETEPGTTDCSILPPIVNNDGPYCVGETIHLTAIGVQGASYSWTGPNNYRSRYQNPNRSNCTMAMAGPYICTITKNGQSACDTTWVEVYPNAVASFTASATTVCVGSPVDFTSTSTTNPAGYSIETSEWDFGDGQTASGATQSHTFNQTGTFTVTLNVATEGGYCTDEITQTITVSEGEEIQFDPVTSCTPYTWTEGNGETYSEPGVYEVVYETQTESGCPRTEYITITISDVEETETSITECDSYIWTDGDGQTYNTSGDYVFNTTNEQGCPVIKTLHLTINQSEEDETSVSECDTYTWADGNGQTYTASGDYTWNTTTAQGCDKTVTLHLTINQSEEDETSVTECDTYTWADGNGQTYTTSGDYTWNTQTADGCDKTVTLHLTINQSEEDETSVTECDTYTWADGNGQTYTSSGDYTWNTTTAQGCDKTVTLHLTINNSEEDETSVTECDTYTWADGNGQTYTSSGDYVWNTTTAQGCDKTVTLHLTINNSEEDETSVTECDTYTWADGNGQTYTSSGDYVWNTTTAQGCDKTVTLHLTINNSEEDETSVTECDTYTWADGNGQTYTSSGDYVWNTTTAQGCDKTVTLHLTINNSEEDETSVTECDTYTWADGNGQTYTSSGDYVWNTTTAQGCDKTVTLHLTINNSEEDETSVTECDTYTWADGNGQTYTASGDYVWNTTTAQGCDKTVTLHLTINNSEEDETSVTECDTYTWADGNGQTYTASGDYVWNTTTAQGCDKTVTLHLTINNSEEDETSVTECDTYTWADGNGQTYTASGDYVWNTTTAQGCDKTVTLHLTINNSEEDETSVTECDTYTWADGNGQTYTASGDYTWNTTTAQGCDKTVTLHLTINNSEEDETSVTECDTYTWADGNGQTYTSSGDYVWNTTTAQGCDKTVTLHLTINNSEEEDYTVTECDTYTWPNNGQTYTTSGDYVFNTTTAQGCPRTETLHLTINNSEEEDYSVTECDTYTWPNNGQTYTTSGDYVFNTTTAQGCPRTETLHLTINNSEEEDYTVTECDTYTWPNNGQTYTTSGDYVFNTTTTQGCPRTETLHLTINYSEEDESSVTECDTYTWANGNGQTYTSSGDYVWNTTTAQGCDKTVTLHLTINNSEEEDYTVTECDTYTWPNNGQTYTTSGDYVFNTTTAQGCPRTETLHLTINNSEVDETSITECDTYTWADGNGQTYTSSGDYVWNTTTAQGCDKTVTLHLTINYSEEEDFNVTECDSYTWHGTNYTQGGTYTFDTQTAQGCPRTETLNLTINYSETEEFDVTECDSYTWADGNGQTYTSSGTYVNNTTTAQGCPRTETLHLTINTSEEEDYTVTECDTYTWPNNGETYTTSGTYVNNTTTAQGCPRTETLHLTINNSEEEEYNVTECDSYTWHGTNYTQGGTYTFDTQTAQGCPRTETLNLTINYSEEEDFNVTECDSYNWHGTNYTQSGTYTFDTQTAQGCDRTETLHLTINNSETEEFNVTECDSYTWHGTTYTSSGNYIFNTETAQGCERIETLHLTINQSETEEFNVTECDSYTWHGTQYTSSGNYTFETETEQGCLRTETLHLTINESENITLPAVTECDSYTWYGTAYTTSGNYTHESTTPEGCLRVETLPLTINNSETEEFTETACDSYTWHGTTYNFSGNYAYETTTAAGCPRTETLHLTINNSETEEFTDAACESYTWHGTTYTTSGNYTYNTTTAEGCPRTETLHLTISDVIQTDFSMQVCNNYTWNGQTYNASGNYTQQFTSIQGCDSIVTLHLTISDAIQTEFTDQACDSYTWNGTPYTASGNYTQQFTSVQGCDSIVTLHLTINHSETEDINETACDAFTWHGTQYTESGNYTFETTTPQGCQKIETLHLTINQSETAEFTETQCDSYTWHGTEYTASGNYTFETTTPQGCQRIETLHLTINNSENVEITAASCDTYTWHGTQYNTSGTYTYNTTTAEGCPRTETLYLTISDVIQTEFTQQVCDSYTWNGQTYNTSGDYTQQFTTMQGCDSIVTLHLTISDAIQTEFTEQVCDSYTWNGIPYNSSGNYTQEFTSAQGCDSIVTLHLTVNHSETEDFTEAACDSYTWHGTQYTESGNYTFETTTPQGCERIETLHLTINHSEDVELTAASCDSYTWHGTTYTSSGTYTYETTTAAGCERIETLHLTISDVIQTEFTQQVCDSYTWNGQTYNTSGNYTQQFTTMQGCDSIVTLHLTISDAIQTEFTEQACDSYTWNGVPYTTSGNYTQEFTSAQGCDSIVTLHLTVNHSETEDFNETACDAFTWHGTQYTESGNYTFETTTPQGCQRIETLHLTINNSETEDFTMAACESYTWHGTTYTASGTYTFNTTTAAGCERLETLYLTISDVIETEFTQQTCESYVWNGQTYDASGNYTQQFTSVQGCDSIVTLHLTISDAIQTEFSQQACENFTWNGTTYDASGDYTQQFTSVQGCDSIVTLHLTISDIETEDFTVTECDTYTWHGTTYTSSGTYTFETLTPAGCQRIETLYLTINNSETEDFTMAACESYTWHGTTYTASGTYTFNTTTAAGCERLETLYLTISDVIETEFTQQTCQSYTWNGQTYDATGNYTQQFTSVQGCDSIVTLHLTISDAIQTEFSQQACENFTWNGQTYDASGDYTQQFTSVQGCDSIVTLHLTISDVETEEFTETACESFTWHGTQYNASGNYTFETTTPQGCLRIETLHLTINSAFETEWSQQAYNSFTWNGITYDVSGDYTQTFTSQQGCDSIVTLHLTIDNEVVTNEFTDFACDNYTWNGISYTASGDYVQHFPSQHQGDSVVTLHLTIYNAVTTQWSEQACDSYEWDGMTYTRSGDYTREYTTQHGCDSTVTLHLTLGHSSENHTNITTCESYVWYGTLYTEEGTYEHMEHTATGCDSLMVLHLSIGTSFISEESQTACDSYFWRNKLCYETGIYTDESPNPDGCDSTFILNLTINPSVTTHIAEKACREYEWYGTIYNESGDYEYVEQNVFGCDSTVILHLSIDEGLSTGIHGQSTISPATNLIMGVYTYYIDSTNIDPSNVRWSLDRPDWRITPHRASCRVTCLSEGEAKLRAWTENEFCDIDTTLILLGRFFDVDENDEPELSVYPNPTRGQVTVSWHEIEEVNVIDMLGQRLISYKLGRVESCELNIRDYAHGVYMLEIISSSGTAYRPVVRGLY